MNDLLGNLMVVEIDNASRCSLRGGQDAHRAKLRSSNAIVVVVIE